MDEFVDGTGVRTVLSGQAVVDETGVALVQLPHQAPGDLIVTEQTVRGDNPAGPAIAGVYRNLISAATLVEASRTGGKDDSDTHLLLHTDESLLCLWSGANPGTTVTYQIAGTRYPTGQPSQE